ncbi:transcriptional regulator [Spirochaetia bacterium]|nr:transcriptional regulator [Spirochaetia bacterium]
MRISTKGRYSLEAMLYIALLPGDIYSSTREIAEKTGISEGYLEQLFIPLRRAGFLCGIRGPQGGYLLGKPAKEIKVGSIVRSVEGPLQPTPCVQPNICPKQEFCTSRFTWSRLYIGINECLDTISLQNLVDDFRSRHEPEYSI